MTPSLAASLGLGLLVAAALVVAWVVAGRPRAWAWLPWVVGAVVGAGWAFVTRRRAPAPEPAPKPDPRTAIADEYRRWEQARAVEEHAAHTEEVRAEVAAGDREALAARLDQRHRGRASKPQETRGATTAPTPGRAGAPRRKGQK